MVGSLPMNSSAMAEEIMMSVKGLGTMYLLEIIAKLVSYIHFG